MIERIQILMEAYLYGYKVLQAILYGYKVLPNTICLEENVLFCSIVLFLTGKILWLIRLLFSLNSFEFGMYDLVKEKGDHKRINILTFQ